MVLLDYESENINPAASTRRYSTRRNCQKEFFNVDNTNIEEMKYGDAEYTLSLKKYLGEAINENEKVIISNKFKFVFLIFLT